MKIDVGGGLFRSKATVAPAPARTEDDGFDPVMEEVERWARLPRADYAAYYDKDGLLNEFEIMWVLRDKFPLHFIVFKQTACHLAHVANVEQVLCATCPLHPPAYPFHPFIVSCT